MPSEKLLAEMASYHEELQKAGGAARRLGLEADPARLAYQVLRLQSHGDRRAVHGDAKELVAGYTIIDVKSREEALEWTKRFPNPSIDHGEAEIEVRQYFELEDFGQSERSNGFARWRSDGEPRSGAAGSRHPGAKPGIQPTAAMTDTLLTAVIVMQSHH